MTTVFLPCFHNEVQSVDKTAYNSLHLRRSMANPHNTSPKRHLDASSPSARKAGGFQELQPMNFQTPRMEDRQASYAQNADTESNTYGWYSNMSTFLLYPPFVRAEEWI